MFNDIKKQASSFVQEKYKSAKLALVDVTEAELLTEEVINNDPWGPDAKTMTRISEAAYDMDDYWRIVGIIHRKLQSVNYKEWRESYKALVLLEFLLTHGPEDMFEEFHCDINVIRDLKKLNYLDERGFNWGACMKQKSEKLQKLLSDETHLMEARSKALKISKEIQGFGNLIVVSPSSASSRTSRTSSFGSCSSDSPTSILHDDTNKREQRWAHESSGKPFQPSQSMMIHRELEGLRLWNSPIQEKGSLVEEGEKDKSPNSWSSRFRTRIFGSCNKNTTDQTNNQNEATVLRSISDVGKKVTKKKKKIDRQLPLQC